MTVTFYDSLEDMMEAEQQAKMAADARIREYQWKIKKGDYVFYDSGYGFPIFAKVLEEYKDDHMKSYVLCDAFSEACPDGERGDIHRSIIANRIKKETFDEFKENGWHLFPDES